MGKYSVQSHVPIFKKMFETFDINSVFEYGIGLHSTPIFIDNCEKVLSIEMNTHSLGSQTWYEKVVEEIGDRDNWTHDEMHGPHKAISYAKELFGKETFDLVFADGHGDTRHQQTNSGFGSSRFVICHDSQHQHTRHGWEIPDNYYKIDFVDYCRACEGNVTEKHWATTTVFCNNEQDAEVVKSWLGMEKEVCSLHFTWADNK